MVLKKVNQYYNEYVCYIYYKEGSDEKTNVQKITGSDLDITFQTRAIEDKLLEAWNLGRQGSVFARKKAFDSLLAEPLVLSSLPILVDMNINHLNKVLRQVSKAVYKAPVDTRVQLGEGTLSYTQEKKGQALDEEQLKSDIITGLGLMAESSFNAQEYLAYTNPAVTKEQLREKHQLLGSYSTQIYMMTRDENSQYISKNRLSNISLSLAAITKEVPAGGEFSFNRSTGYRTEEKGYKPATEYVRGEMSLGIGGGVCQASSTLYQAAEQAGLKITERHTHGGELGYIEAGKDATVNYIRGHEKDFSFKNTTGQSIFIVGTVQRGMGRHYICKVDIYGTPPNPS